MNKRLLWTLSGCLIGIGISLCLTSATAKIQRFKTPSEQKQMLAKHEKGLTLEKLADRITKNENDINQLKKGK